LGRLADKMFKPFMYLVAGTIWEAPQGTHFWNNQKIGSDVTQQLDYGDMVINCDSDTSIHKRRFLHIPIFHIPILGGWRDYLVIEPSESQSKWYIGWVGDESGISRIPITGNFVRVLVGSQDAIFFGINERGEQIKLFPTPMRGRIGEGGSFADVPLR
jgi:hypothetical protein